jgi:hypothetical protein
LSTRAQGAEEGLAGGPCRNTPAPDPWFAGHNELKSLEMQIGVKVHAIDHRAPAGGRD